MVAGRKVVGGGWPFVVDGGWPPPPGGWAEPPRPGVTALFALGGFGAALPWNVVSQKTISVVPATIAERICARSKDPVSPGRSAAKQT